MGQLITWYKSITAILTKHNDYFLVVWQTSAHILTQYKDRFCDDICELPVTMDLNIQPGQAAVSLLQCKEESSICFTARSVRNVTEELLACALCNSTKTHQQKVPHHPVPHLPWSTVVTDIFDWQGKHYQVHVDSYSGWFEIDLLHDMSSNMISKLKRHFSVHGRQC